MIILLIYLLFSNLIVCLVLNVGRALDAHAHM